MFYFFLCVGGVGECHGTHVKAREQLEGASSLPTIGSQGSNFRCQDWWQYLYPLSYCIRPREQFFFNLHSSGMERSTSEVRSF